MVDDEPPLRKVLNTILSARGFAVEEGGSAERALELARQRVFDLILLDINMPRNGRHRGLPVLPHVVAQLLQL